MLQATQDAAFREALLKAPKATLEAQMGVPLPEGFKVNVVENTSTEVTLVIPPLLADDLSDADLDGVAGGVLVDSSVPGFSLASALIGCIISMAATRRGKNLRCSFPDFLR